MSSFGDKTLERSKRHGKYNKAIYAKITHMHVWKEVFFFSSYGG
jgi:hypothetical protein